MLNMLGRTILSRSITTSQGPLFFRETPVLLAEPLKKKKKLDPIIVKQREERKRKRLEKMIRKLEKGSKQLKPIEECEVPEELRNGSKYVRKISPISEDIANQRKQLLKEWSVYMTQRQLADIKMCDRLVLSQQWALDQLKIESKDLYNAAIEIDTTLLPLKSDGPVETPPIKGYDSPDGEYIDISRKWD